MHYHGLSRRESGLSCRHLHFGHPEKLKQPQRPLNWSQFHRSVTTLHSARPSLRSYTMTDAFSTPAEHAFDHPEIDIAPEAGPSSLGNALSGVSIEEAFEVEDAIQRILEGGYKTVRSL